MKRLPGVLALALAALAGSGPAHAIEIKIVENQMILSGGIDSNDGWTFNRTVSNNPRVDTIVLRNMPGGKVSAMDVIAETVEDRQLNTVVSARCMSACAHIFMAGKNRQFSDDFPTDWAHLGFHSAYRSEGSLKGWGGQPVTNAHLWYVKRTNGKIDADLVLRWMSLEQSSGFAYFYYPAQTKVRSSPSYLCVRGMPIEQCEKISKTAFDYGIITSMELVPVKDPPFWKAERYKRHGAVKQLLDGDVVSSSKKSIVDEYMKKSGPRAMALSENGRWLFWSPHRDGLLAIMSAVSRCESKAERRCHVIAIDDELTQSLEAIKAEKFE